MADYKIKIDGMRQLKSLIKKAPEVTKKEMNKAMFKSALAVQSKVKAYAPVRTGNLRRSITHEVTPKKAIVFTNLLYAKFLEFGTRAHGPRKWSHMTFRINERWVRTKRVRGIRPRFFFRRGFKDSTPVVNRIFDNAIQNILKFMHK